MDARRLAVLLMLALPSTTLMAAPHAHEHGAVRLDVAVDGAGLSIGIESALHDLLGRHLCVPVSAILGGKARTSLLALTQLANPDVEQDLASGALVEILRDFSPGDVDLQIVYPGRAAQPTRVRALIDRLAQDPIDPAQPARGRLATEARVDDPPREFLRVDFLLNIFRREFAQWDRTDDPQMISSRRQKDRHGASHDD